MRSWLTILGIVVGIGAVVALVSISMGLSKEVERQFQLFGSDKIFITARISGGGGGFGGAIGGLGLTEEDAEIVRDVNGVELTAFMLAQSLPVKFGDETQFISVIGISTDQETKRLFEEIQGFKIDKGDSLEPGDKYKAMGGYLLGTGDVFENEVKIGNKLEVMGKEFKLIGTYEPIGNDQDDSQIIVPIESLREVTGVQDDVTVIFVKVKDGYNTSEVRNDIEHELRDAKNQEEGAETFGVNTTEDILKLINQLFGTIQIVLIGIGGISLVVGSIGVMNTMYTAVLDRTKEIGIMKAIGAKNSDVIKIFLIESSVLGLVGGVVGIILGIVMAKAVESAATTTIMIPLKAYIGLDLIVGAILLSLVIGTLSGVLPARRAAQLEPVDALRYE